MGLKKWLGIEKLEKENEILRNYIKSQNQVINNIERVSKDYQSKNYIAAHVGFYKIQKIALQGIDCAAQKEIELAKID